MGEKGSGKSAIVLHLSFLSLKLLSKFAVDGSRSVLLRPCLATGEILMISSELAGTFACCRTRSLFCYRDMSSRDLLQRRMWGPEDAPAQRNKESEETLT